MNSDTPDLFENMPEESTAPPLPPEPPESPPLPPLPPEPPEQLPDDALPLDLFVEQAYLAYAMSVVKSRALPQVEDGQKRCSGASSTQCTIGSARRGQARQVGARRRRRARQAASHGDSSVYDAMVRIARTSACATRSPTARATSARATATALPRCATRNPPDADRRSAAFRDRPRHRRLPPEL